MVKIVDNRGQYKITIPKDLVDSKGWGRDTRLRFVEDTEGNVILKVIENKENSKNSKRRQKL